MESLLLAILILVILLVVAHVVMAQFGVDGNIRLLVLLTILILFALYMLRGGLAL